MFPSSLLGLVNSLLKNNIEQHLTNSQITTVHPSRDGHSIDISACGVWGVGGKGRDSNLQEGVSYTYIFRLLYIRILSCVKKKKKNNLPPKFKNSHRQLSNKCIIGGVL